MIAAARLISYVARPTRPVALAAATIACFALGSWGIRWGTTQKPIADGFIALSMLGVGIVLGSCTAFVVSRDVDRAETLLLSMPRSFVWPLGSRFAAWFALSVAVVSTVAVSSAPYLRVADTRAIVVSLVPYLLAAGVAAIAGRLSAALIGAGVGLGAGGFYLGISMFVPEWSMALPLDPSRPDFGASLGSAVTAASITFVAAVSLMFLTLRRTAGRTTETDPSGSG